ncbi:MAG: glutamate racemase [Candidatus Magasanikbacteria bacterium]|nr:glutamate racemase [Candidatus Magasanikbacteria bacterium]
MIGVFDSGIGGLTVLHWLLKELPEYDYVYIGDNARAPYGNRSQEIVYEYTRQEVEYLFNSGAQLVVLACNTASSLALRRLQQEWLPQHFPDRRILGVLIPLVETALKTTKTGIIGVVGTRGTIASGAVTREFEKRKALVRPDLARMEIFSASCPLLVPLTEEGWIDRSETKRIMRHYVRELKQKNIDTLLLACTHYPLLYDQFSAIMGKKVQVIDNRAVALSLKNYFERHPDIATLCRSKSETPKRMFLTTDDPERFSNLSSRFLGEQIEAHHVAVL